MVEVILFNKDLKEQFINSQYKNAGSKEVIKDILRKAYTSELILKKDLYDFTLDEIGEVIRAADPFNVSMSYSYARHIYRYIRYAKENGYGQSNINPLEVVPDSWYEQWVDNKKNLFTKNEIEDLVENLKNKQDKAMVALFFEGAFGKQFSELRNLKVSDIDEINFKLKLTDDKDHKSRELNISEWCMNLVLQAAKSTSYTTFYLQTPDTVPLVDNEYVFRQTRGGRSSEYEGMGMNQLYQRIRSIRDNFNLPYFRAKGVQQSGMNYMGFKLYQRDGELGSKQFVEISNHFNVGYYVPNGKYRYLNTFDFKKYVNKDEINKLYGTSIND
jgi:integrase